ncbi:MAG: serine/threonine protein kinase [Planctomycetes bacterium]|nr:serine/threonine protein kinase [Planctomycetota bacterium]NBY02577.1 serine/threonine protein kinase [Planctomycetota bacterium]
MSEPSETPDTVKTQGYFQPLGKIGHYDLLKKIAEGGMGSIYMARNTKDKTVVAIKVMSPNYVHNPVLLKRFEQEYRVASKFNHPNLVRALEFGTENGLPFLVLEFVNGESLGVLISKQGKFEELEGIKIIAQVAKALNQVHKDKLIHRDVKPDNILVGKNGIAKLTDLGLVKEVSVGDLNLTRSGRGLGTPNFMAPEQFRDAKNADIRCDIYSLGATLYTMLTGELPYKSVNPLETWMKKVQNDLPTPRELNPRISERTDWAIRRAMDSDPDIRPSSCREFVEDLVGKSTRKSTVNNAALEKANIKPPSEAIWFMAYNDDQGKQHVVKGTAKAIRRSFKDGILEDPIKYKLGKSAEGPFEDMKIFPEFRDLAVHLTKPNTNANSKTKQDGEPTPITIPDESSKITKEPKRPQTETPSKIYYVVGAGVVIAISLIIYAVISLR